MSVLKVKTASDDEVKELLYTWLSAPYNSKQAIVIKGGTLRQKPFISGTEPVKDGWSTTGGLLYPTITTPHGRFSRLLLEVCQAQNKARQFLALHSSEDYTPFLWFSRIANATEDEQLVHFVKQSERGHYDPNVEFLVTVSEKSQINEFPVFQKASKTKYVFADAKDAQKFDPALTLIQVDLDD